MRRMSLLTVPLVVGLSVCLPAFPSTALANLSAAPTSAPEVQPAVQGDDDTGSVTVTDDGWIHYDSRLEELGVESETLAVDGVPGPDGACTASGQETGSASDTAITVREEVAFNPATCDSVYLVPK